MSPAASCGRSGECVGEGRGGGREGMMLRLTDQDGWYICASYGDLVSIAGYFLHGCSDSSGV